MIGNTSNNSHLTDCSECSITVMIHSKNHYGIEHKKHDGDVVMIIIKCDAGFTTKCSGIDKKESLSTQIAVLLMSMFDYLICTKNASKN